mmetsp:Transcript_22587/g.34224  ORF Transcript_22587/g.34224 Transcript_22587/m.34224 type:complete len:105 (-) Transcript_22587:301-615(-)
MERSGQKIRSSVANQRLKAAYLQRLNEIELTQCKQLKPNHQSFGEVLLQHWCWSVLWSWKRHSLLWVSRQSQRFDVAGLYVKLSAKAQALADDGDSRSTPKVPS